MHAYIVYIVRVCGYGVLLYAHYTIRVRGGGTVAATSSETSLDATEVRWAREVCYVYMRSSPTNAALLVESLWK